MNKPRHITLQELPEEEMKRLNKMLGRKDKVPGEPIKTRLINSWYSRVLHKVEEIHNKLKIK